MTTTEVAAEYGLATYIAIGRTMLADGWTPEGEMFSFFVPRGDKENALEYGRALRSHKPGCIYPGTQEVTRVTPCDPHGRSPRNKGRVAIAVHQLGHLPPAPDGSRWALRAVSLSGIRLTRHTDNMFHGESETLTWEELRGAAAGDEWYAELLHRAERAMLC